MVDYNNENTITTSPSLIVKVSYLERRKYVLDAIEYYQKTLFMNQQSGAELSILKSRLISLYYEIKESLCRNMKGKECEELAENIASTKYEDLIKAWEVMNKWFDTVRLTKIDNIKPYDSTNAELENKEKGL